jgi:hypothetical protein
MASSDQQNQKDPKQQMRPFQAIFAGLSEDPNRRLDAFAEISHAFRRVLADEMQPVIRALLQGAPPTDEQHRRELARHVNQVLHDVGLAIVDPISRQAASVVADPHRLRLQSRTTNSGKSTRSASTLLLPPLELTECSRQEPFLTWRARTAGNNPPNEKIR